MERCNGMQDAECKDTCYLPGRLPQAGSLAGSRIISHRLHVCQPLFLFLMQHVDDGRKFSVLSQVLLRGVLDMCVEGALELLLCMLDVVAADVDVVDPLSEVAVASG